MSRSKKAAAVIAPPSEIEEHARLMRRWIAEEGYAPTPEEQFDLLLADYYEAKRLYDYEQARWAEVWRAAGKRAPQPVAAAPVRPVPPKGRCLECGGDGVSMTGGRCESCNGTGWIE